MGSHAVIIIINKVLQEKCEIMGKKKRHNVLCARHYLDKEKAEPETWDNDSLGIMGNQRGTILGPGKKIVLSFKGTMRVLQQGICPHAKASREEGN